MTDYIICRPAPSDAELQAERDRQHALEVAQWFAEHPDLGGDQ